MIITFYYSKIFGYDKINKPAIIPVDEKPAIAKAAGAATNNAVPVAAAIPSP